MSILHTNQDELKKVKCSILRKEGERLATQKNNRIKPETPVKGLQLGYILLIALALLQELLVFWHIHNTGTFTGRDLLFSSMTFVALLAGAILPFGITVVTVFVFFVLYLVWLATYAPAEVIVITWILIIPANLLVAALIKRYFIRSNQFAERLGNLEQRNPQIDLYTTLGNKLAFADAIVKQSNLARRYSDKYSFCIAMFKIEFLPLVQESLGAEGYSTLLLDLSEKIQTQLRYEDYKFSIDGGRFIIICPLTRPDLLESMTQRIKRAMMDMPVTDLRGGPLKLVIRAGTLVFDPNQFSQYENVEDVISTLERSTETDLIGEFI